MPADLLTLNLGAVAVVMGAAWKLSRDITTLQVKVQLLTQGMGELKTEVARLRSPE